MRIIMSPAKKMREDRELLAPDSLPVFLPEAETLLRRLRELDYLGLKALWRCSDAVARPNYERLRTADLRHHLTPAQSGPDRLVFCKGGTEHVGSW